MLIISYLGLLLTQTHEASKCHMDPKVETYIHTSVLDPNHHTLRIHN